MHAVCAWRQAPVLERACPGRHEETAVADATDADRLSIALASAATAPGFAQ